MNPQHNPDVNTFLCLACALGQDVPRARQLRAWVGPPTNGPKPEDMFNTLAPPDCVKMILFR